MQETLSNASVPREDSFPGRPSLHLNRNATDRQVRLPAGLRPRWKAAGRAVAIVALWFVPGLFPGTAFALPPMGDHYSPRENLETIDIRVLESARRTIDIAMYAFTDRTLADVLLKEAGKGVRIRIYRDKTQIHDRGDRMHTFLGQKNIAFRIKGNGPRNIMHLKAYAVDGTILRTGSANWSPVGEGAFHCDRHPVSCRTGRLQQDNNLFLTGDPGQAKRFEKTFERLWNRGSNVKDPESYVRDQSQRHSRRRRHEHHRSMY
jgi:phosphatidylserine/phosphatidylglycerophosphate/cardiolipin synthase-like enzyme